MTPPVSFERLTPMPRTRDMSATIGFYTDLLGFSCPARIFRSPHRSSAVCNPAANFDYGMREFAIYDNNGYLPQFGTPV